MDFHGGVGSRRVANRIRGVSRYNPVGRVYHHASKRREEEIWQDDSQIEYAETLRHLMEDYEN